MSLLRQIQDAAIDSSVGLPTLLRKCKVLAARLGSEEFKRWIEYELSGYLSKDQLPDYRILRVNSKGHFSGAYGSGLRNADIPLYCVPEDLREVLGHCYLTTSVAAMESLVSGNYEGHFNEPWDPDLVVYLGSDIYQYMNCMQAWKIIPKGAVVAALDAVRTRVLNFVLEIEAENPSAGEAALNSNPLPMEKVSQIFNTYITGTVQNLAPGSSNFQQTATYTEKSNAEVFSQLLEAVKNAGLQSEASRSVEVAVEEMQAAQGTSSFKQRYQNFISLLADHMQVLGPVVAPFLPALTAMVP
jgi:hypothetical protein